MYLNLNRGRSQSRPKTRAIYDHPDQGDNPQYDWYRAADAAWTKKVQRFLVENYGEHHFCADIDSRQGVIKLYIPELMGAINGFILHMYRMKNESDFDRELHRGCGQTLERFNIPRAGFSRADFFTALTKRPLGGQGLNNSIVPG